VQQSGVGDLEFIVAVRVSFELVVDASGRAGRAGAVVEDGRAGGFARPRITGALCRGSSSSSRGGRAGAAA
jgi:hypothetical protein